MYWTLLVQRRLAALVALCALAGCGGGGGGGSPAPTPTTPTPLADSIAPETQIAESYESELFAVNTITFTPTSNESGVTYEGSVDGGAFATIGVPWVLTGLQSGEHSVAIRARDTAGNVDASPFAFTWIVDTVAPVATIEFPLPNTYSNASRIRVRGQTSDASGIASVQVNGVEASVYNARTWSAEIPLSLVGFTIIQVSSRDTLGNYASAADVAIVNSGPPLLNAIGGMDYDPPRQRLVVSDPLSNSVYSVSVNSGATTIISGNGSPGARTISGSPGPLVVDAANNRAVLVDSGNLIAINLATGSRSLLSEFNGDFELYFGGSTSIALDSQNSRAFVATRGTSSVLEVNLSTGVRTVVASATVGSGETLNEPSALVYDNVTTPGTPRLLVSEHYSLGTAAQLLQIDLATRVRTTFDPTSAGSVELGGASAMKIDTAGGRRVFALDRSAQRVVEINLDTGDRAAISDSSIGSGDAIDHQAGMALAGTRLFAGQSRGEVLAINVNDGTRSTLVHSRAGSGARMSTALGLRIEQATGSAQSLLVTEALGDRLTRVDLMTGNRTVISDISVGTGAVAIETPVDVVLDTRVTGKALVLLAGRAKKLISVDLANGNRSLVADLSGLQRPWSLILDAERNRVLITDDDSVPSVPSAIYSVDITSGIVSEVSGSTRGSGQALLDAGHLILDPTNPDRAIISDTGRYALTSVDLATGNRYSFLSTGNADLLPGPLFHDAANNRIVGFDALLNGSLFSLPLDTMSKRLISGAGNSNQGDGSGPLLGVVYGLDVDTVNQIAFLSDASSSAILAVDLFSGDRVLLSH